MIRILSSVILTTALLSPNATAQESLNELEELSRTSDDPFGEIVTTQQRQPVSVTLRALNKITARYIDIEAQMNELARFGSLEIVPRFCDKRPPEEFPETAAFLEVFDLEQPSNDQYALVSQPDHPAFPGGPIDAPLEPDAGIADEIISPDIAVRSVSVIEGPETDGERIFTGWMFASSPALNALEHPVYDVWVIDCKTAPVDK